MQVVRKTDKTSYISRYFCEAVMPAITIMLQSGATQGPRAKFLI